MATTEIKISDTVTLSEPVVDNIMTLNLLDCAKDIVFDWNNPVGSATDTISIINNTPNNRLNLAGEGADIVIDGVSLTETLHSIQQRLNILAPNVQMEAEWEELREMGQRYRELEKRCIEKSQMWKQLTTMPPPEIK
jgi:hypothetical protein